jgi:hypothetical protein
MPKRLRITKTFGMVKEISLDIFIILIQRTSTGCSKVTGLCYKEENKMCCMKLALRM